MAIKSFLGLQDFKPSLITEKNELLRRFQSQETINIATGITCAFLGDGRNLREFLVAADAVEALKAAGHIVNLYLFSDDLDPLNHRQLRVAVHKVASEIEKFKPFCGKPISHLPAPDDSGRTWSGYFERKLLQKLAIFDCYPNLVSVSKLYSGSIYRRYVDTVLDKRKDIEKFLAKTFPNYTPQALFHPLCPACGSIVETTLTSYSLKESVINCKACDLTSAIPTHALQGKLNWKLDCAARWNFFQIDIEPFSKAYLDPNAGAYEVAKALGNAFFGPIRTNPLLIGTVKVESDISTGAFQSIPSETLKLMMTERWSNDITISKQRVKLAAAKAGPSSEEPVSAVAKRELPKLAVRRMELDLHEAELFHKLESFSENFLVGAAQNHQPDLGVLKMASTKHLQALSTLLSSSIEFRREPITYAEFDAAIKTTADSLGVQFNELGSMLRTIVGQHRGLPTRRLLFTMPMPILDLLTLATSSLYESRKTKAELADAKRTSALVVGKTSVRLDADGVIVVS